MFNDRNLVTFAIVLFHDFCNRPLCRNNHKNIKEWGNSGNGKANWQRVYKLLGPSFQLMLIRFDASVLESTLSWELCPGFALLALVCSWLIWQQQRPLFFRRRFFADFAAPAEISNLLQIFRKWTTQRFRQQQVEEPADDWATSKDGHDDPGVLLGLVGNPGCQCYETFFCSSLSLIRVTRKYEKIAQFF